MRIDTLVYQCERQLLDPNEASVVTRLHAPDLAVLAMAVNRIVVPGSYSQRMGEGDTLDVSLVRMIDARYQEIHMVADIVLADEIAGLYAHALIRKTRSGWILVRRWIVEG